MIAKIPLIIDTDPGVDDAITLLMAAHEPSFDILGITTVGGNVMAAQTQANARGIMALAGRHDVRVYAGADRPLCRPDIIPADYVHGQSGVQGLRLPSLQSPAGDGHAVDFIIRTVRDHPEPVTIICIGPMTNLAMALQQAPDIAEHIARVVAMIGCVGDIRATIPQPPLGDYPIQGNMSPHGEFNAWTDPDAAAIVFGAIKQIVMFPLDITHQTLLTQARRDALRAIGGDFGVNIAHMLDQTAASYPGFAGVAAPLHDPHTVAWLLRPDMYQMRQGQVDVHTDWSLFGGGDLRGRTNFMPLCDGNVHCVYHVDAALFFDVVIDALKYCYKKC